MRTIGKISEENHTFMIIKKNYVLSGKLRILSDHTLMGVQMNTDANIVMVGKSNSITQEIIKSIHVNFMKSAKKLIVHIIIMIMIGGLL